MAIVYLDSSEDPRLTPYRDLTGRPERGDGKRFIVEGRFLVERLLASTRTTESILTDAARLPTLPGEIGEQTTVFVLPSDTIDQLVGFEFHRGMLACGLRCPLPAIDDLVPAAQLRKPSGRRKPGKAGADDYPIRFDVFRKRHGGSGCWQCGVPARNTPIPRQFLSVIDGHSNVDRLPGCIAHALKATTLSNAFPLSPSEIRAMVAFNVLSTDASSLFSSSLRPSNSMALSRSCVQRIDDVRAR